MNWSLKEPTPKQFLLQTGNYPRQQGPDSLKEPAVVVMLQEWLSLSPVIGFWGQLRCVHTDLRARPALTSGRGEVLVPPLWLFKGKSLQASGLLEM